jgi:hypothetical protein
MQHGDKEIYIQDNGSMVKVGHPTNPDYPNFVITYRGRDWSGFRTLAECERQFPTIETRKGDHFAVVQR